MTTHYNNLNADIAALVQAVKTAENRNTLIVFTRESLFDLDATANALTLTQTELLAAKPIEDMVEASQFIRSAMLQLHRFMFAIENSDKNIPAYMKLDNNNEEDFSDFFTHIDEVPEQYWNAVRDYGNGANKTSVLAAKTRYETAQNNLNLKKEERAKVEQAIDFRDYLIADLKVHGYSFQEIEAIRAHH